MRSDLVYRGKIGVRRLIPSFPKRAEKRREWTKSAYKGATGSELKLAHGRASDAIGKFETAAGIGGWPSALRAGLGSAHTIAAAHKSTGPSKTW